MAQFDGKRVNEDTAVVKSYEGFGELMTGTSDPLRLVFIALCMLNDPKINSLFLDFKVKMSDRITKSAIFPRPGMPLADGSVFVSPVETPASSKEEV